MTISVSVRHAFADRPTETLDIAKLLELLVIHGVTATGAVRQAVRRLCEEGAILRVERGRYQFNVDVGRRSTIPLIASAVPMARREHVIRAASALTRARKEVEEARHRLERCEQIAAARERELELLLEDRGERRDEPDTDDRDRAARDELAVLPAP